MREFLVKLFNNADPRLASMINAFRYRGEYVAWKKHEKGMAFLKETLGPLKDKYKGHRCVVIGNGPSINKMDLSVLKDEFTFGMNRIYLKFEEWGFQTDFLACVNDTVLNQFADDFNELNMPKFLNWKYRKPFLDADNTYLLPLRPGLKPKGDITKGIYNCGYTVTSACLEIAYYLGFSEIILIGVDHSYKESGHGGKSVKAEGDDVNHFHKDYFGKGVVWQLPNLSGSEYSYARLREFYEANDRSIVDATLGGKLQIFEKANFEETLKRSVFKNKADFGE